MADFPASPSANSQSASTSSNEMSLEPSSTNEVSLQPSTSNSNQLLTSMSPAMRTLLSSPTITRKRRRVEGPEEEEEEQFMEDGVLYLKVKPNTYFLRSGQEIPALEGSLPMQCFVCYKIIEIDNVTSIPHMKQHEDEKLCKVCAKTILLSDEVKCPMCREDDIEVICHFCKNSFPPSEVVLSFHEHLDENACLMCLAIMLRPTNGSTKLLRCPSHSAATYVDMSGVKAITAEMKKNINYMAVVMKAYAEQLKDLATALPATADLWHKMIWNYPLRAKLSDH